ncbi:glycosyl transferase [Paenibacillus sp. PCH8]|uniref:glycosyltransferase family 2 protein n=1 Tax=Paenibacillus sp. PCH8 TaxID=2066524 RepID=UPI000CF84AB1|nr:glycosyltransferase [Paenibacillus sp. PCH8]PQP80897.1 glycosyl transferase [Paenibacillus sp. PCH8]
MRKTRTRARYATQSIMTRRKAALKKQRLKSRYKKGTKTYSFVIPSRQQVSQEREQAKNGPEHGLRHVSQQGEDSQRPMLSVIIPAMNEERTIGAVVREALRICRDAEVLVIVNGSTDGTGGVAKRAGARVLSYAEALGHDGGRKIGAAAARGQVLLFTDADIAIPAEQLAPYVQAVLKGTDVALNDYHGPVNRSPIHPVVEAKHMLNSILARSDLRGASMTAIPHALSRHGLEVIGISSLEVPPLAQAKAVIGGLRVRAVHHVPVGRMNAVRIKRRSGPDPLSQLVLNDHLEAIRWITETLGSRGGYSDLERVRSLAR